MILRLFVLTAFSAGVLAQGLCDSCSYDESIENTVDVPLVQIESNGIASYVSQSESAGLSATACLWNNGYIDGCYVFIRHITEESEPYEDSYIDICNRFIKQIVAQSEPYDDGYKKGYSAGLDDGENGMSRKFSYNDNTALYYAAEAEQYEKGYAAGYAKGYDEGTARRDEASEETKSSTETPAKSEYFDGWDDYGWDEPVEGY